MSSSRYACRAVRPGSIMMCVITASNQDWHALDPKLLRATNASGQSATCPTAYRRSQERADTAGRPNAAHAWPAQRPVSTSA
ncbi:hypothetical protein XHV734_5013 [Xanthomonas hortorum pv. vitians]|nr:hypothetical protein XHV734_5013 [Xanthomonas hortorum pv. vitians]